MHKDTTQSDFYAFIAPARGGTLLSTHVGDGYDPRGFAEGQEMKVGDPLPAEISGAIGHPVFAASYNIIGLVALVALVLYMDHRIKIPVKL